MKMKVIANGNEMHLDLLKRIIGERIPVEFGTEGMEIELCVDYAIGKEESYQITEEQDKWKITGADVAGLYYGIGKFLHTAKWSEEEFVPQPPKGLVAPDCDFRATYFSIHFYNWYYQAEAEELEKYVEEIMLWGYNTIVCIIPLVNFNSCDEPAFFHAVNKIRSIFVLAKKMNMKVGIIINPNQGLKTTPAEFEADLSCYENRCTIAGKNICPSIPGAMEYMRYLWVMMLKRFMDIGLDYIISWPYDEGGCGCENCRPWGANGFAELSREVCKETKRFYPNAKFIYSTWFFDQPDDEGEFSGLYKRLNDDDMQYIDYLMSDAGKGYQPYVIEHDSIKPIVNFPEISMWRLYPWGGRGANPLPKRFQENWDKTKHVMSGGMPYSEGMYEDISKVQFAGYYWKKDRHYSDILKEYINYEYGYDVQDEVLEMMELIEINHVGVGGRQEPDMIAAIRAEQLAKAVDARLSERTKKAWRWRILYIRACIDLMVYNFYQEKGKEMTWTNPWNRKMKDADGTVVLPGETISALGLMWRTPKEYLADNQEAQDLMQELCDWYHCVDEDPDKGNKYTLPPVKDGKVL